MAHVAFFSLQGSLLDYFATSKNSRERRIFHLLRKPQDLLITLLLCEITANVLTHTCLSHLLPTQGVMPILVPFGLTLFLGQLIPKNLGYSYNLRITKAVIPFLSFLQLLLAPVRKPLSFMTRSVATRLTSLRTESEKREECHYLLQISHQLDLLSSDETSLIEGYLDLSEISVKQKMVHRGDLLFYDTLTPLSKLRECFMLETSSDVLVCEGSLQNPKGTVHLSSLLQIEQGKASLESFLTPPLFVPQNMDLHTLYHKFKNHPSNLALVINEYGTILGNITYDTLLKVWIPYTESSIYSSPPFLKTSSGSVITSGKLELSLFESLYRTKLPKKGEVVTLGGWLTHQMGEIPKEGTSFQWKNFHFKVLRAEPKKIKEIEVVQQ
jgi:putative hemolysin